MTKFHFKIRDTVTMLYNNMERNKQYVISLDSFINVAQRCLFTVCNGDKKALSSRGKQNF